MCGVFFFLVLRNVDGNADGLTRMSVSRRLLRPPQLCRRKKEEKEIMAVAAKAQLMCCCRTAKGLSCRGLHIFLHVCHQPCDRRTAKGDRLLFSLSSLASSFGTTYVVRTNISLSVGGRPDVVIVAERSEMPGHTSHTRVLFGYN